MLLVDPNDTFTVEVYFRKNEGGELEILEEKPKEGETPVEKESFEFKRPNWEDVRIIMANAMVGGDINNVDPMAFMDFKIRTLLRSWSLKDGKGKSLSFENIGKLPPTMMMHLNGRIDDALGTDGLFGSALPAAM